MIKGKRGGRAGDPGVAHEPQKRETQATVLKVTASRSAVYCRWLWQWRANLQASLAGGSISRKGEGLLHEASHHPGDHNELWVSLCFLTGGVHVHKKMLRPLSSRGRCRNWAAQSRSSSEERIIHTHVLLSSTNSTRPSPPLFHWPLTLCSLLLLL